ncbi:MAG TPA: hypothetical protein VNL16_18205 [Chloroflexota bacterium]|nr:hypothetical protein [Chloroflexota bacterium]
MTRDRSIAGDGTRQLARLVRQSRLLDPALKRHWLSVLRYLTPADRTRLEEILRPEVGDQASGVGERLDQGMPARRLS